MRRDRKPGHGGTGKRPSIEDKLDRLIYLANIYAEAGREDYFSDAVINEFGKQRASPEYEAAMQIFREMRAQRLGG